LHRAGKTHPHRPPGPPRRTALLHANTAPSLPAVTDALLAANSRRRALSAGSPYRLTPHTAATARHHLHLTPPPPLAAASPAKHRPPCVSPRTSDVSPRSRSRRNRCFDPRRRPLRH